MYLLSLRLLSSSPWIPRQIPRQRTAWLPPSAYFSAHLDPDVNPLTSLLHYEVDCWWMYIRGFGMCVGQEVVQNLAKPSIKRIIVPQFCQRSGTASPITILVVHSPTSMGFLPGITILAKRKHHCQRSVTYIPPNINNHINHHTVPWKQDGWPKHAKQFHPPTSLNRGVSMFGGPGKVVAIPQTIYPSRNQRSSTPNQTTPPSLHQTCQPNLGATTSLW